MLRWVKICTTLLLSLLWNQRPNYIKISPIDTKTYEHWPGWFPKTFSTMKVIMVAVVQSKSQADATSCKLGARYPPKQQPEIQGWWRLERRVWEETSPHCTMRFRQWRIGIRVFGTFALILWPGVEIFQIDFPLILYLKGQNEYLSIRILKLSLSFYGRPNISDVHVRKI